MVFRERREALHRSLGSDDCVILWLGAELQPRNYPANVYMPFRQNSHFRYYVGLNEPSFAFLSFPDGKDILFGPPVDMDTIVWEGQLPSLDILADQAGATDSRPIGELGQALQELGGDVAYLPPYQADAVLRFGELLGKTPAQVKEGASLPLMKAVTNQRNVKTTAEIMEIEKALGLTRELFHEAMAMTKPGISFSSILGHFYHRVREALWDFSFPPIITTHGEILHTRGYEGILEDGRLILIDMGLETETGYASDITRTWPVNGRYSQKQRDIYEIVVAAQKAAIGALGPGIPYREAHLAAALEIARGLVSLGLMKGNPADALKEGAHALFFPHGVGHMLGADVHDMEDLGDVVGYEEGTKRSEQFGLNFLRLDRKMEEGFVATIEPGIYFIPPLIELWKKENRYSSFINYHALDEFLDFGGIRVEDDVLITKEGSRILGEPIARTVEDIESKIANS